MNKKQELIIVRVFDATRERTWKAFSDPKLFATWYGAPGKLADVSMDFKVGGLWSNTTVMPDGEKYPASGNYRVINEPEYLEFQFGDLKDPEFELVEITLKDLGNRTEMTFRQSGNLPPEEYATGLLMGWTGFFDRLAEIL